MKTVFSFLAVVTLLTTSAYAAEGQVRKSTLDRLGLGGAEILSDSEGMEIRGMARGNAMAMGVSLVTGLILDPDTKSYVIGADVNGAVASSRGRTPVSAKTTQNSSILLKLDVSNGRRQTFSGFLYGGAGGSAYAIAP